jgi:protein-tyrosine phosphatase
MPGLIHGSSTKNHQICSPKLLVKTGGFAEYSMYKFASASTTELIVYGAARPGYTKRQIKDWLEFMHQQGIQRVCCLLAAPQLDRYPNLLHIYQQHFGSERVCWSPIEDFSLVDRSVLMQQILPFLAIADQQQEKVVVHCSGGSGRTGHILAAWLIAKYGMSNHQAIATVQKTGRHPQEAISAAIFKGRNPWQVRTELHTLLNNCRHMV